MTANMKPQGGRSIGPRRSAAYRAAPRQAKTIKQLKRKCRGGAGCRENISGFRLREKCFSLDIPFDRTTEGEHGFRRLSFKRIADGVIADRSDAFGQRPMVTLGLDLQQAGNLHRRPQEDRVKHFFPGVLGKLPPLGQGAYQIGKAKHLVEISLEPVSGQGWRSSFSLRNRFRLTLQMVAAAASKRRRISIFWRTFSTNSAGMLRAFGLPSISTEI